MKKSKKRTTLEILTLLPGLVNVVAKALNPDNAKLPEGLKLEVERINEDRLKIVIEAEDIGTVINTTNDIFACLQPLLKLLNKGGSS